MKTVFVFLLFLVIPVVSRAQDQIFKKDNTKLLVKITEVSPEEIKYKLYNNLNGPIYVENKSNVILIIYENGQHQVVDTSPAKPSIPAKDLYYNRFAQENKLNKLDSAKYHQYSQSVSINFLGFMNSEFALIYQREMYKKHLNVQVPIAFGVGPSGITQSVYFRNRANQYELDRKIFEIGAGINYYPSFRSSVNYYIGPMFRLMQYEGTQIYNNPLIPMGIRTEHKSTLTRYTVTITNGLMFRTRSRLVANVFASIGFANDKVSSMPNDPFSKNRKINPIYKPVVLFIWCGFTVGYCF